MSAGAGDALHSAPPRSAWWARAIAHLPWWLLYGVASGLAFLAWRVFPYRRHVVHENLSLAFPQLDAAALERVKQRYYLGFAQMLVELLKAASMGEQEFRARVTMRNVELAREHLEQGRPVLLIAAHQCNWEWMLLALTIELGYPVDAAYKPLINPWAEREMLALRSRFGGRLIPATNLLAEIIKSKGEPRAIAMVADQEPVSSERKHWTRFLNRDTAFFMGPEEITRVTRYAALFVAIRRIRRGRF